MGMLLTMGDYTKPLPTKVEAPVEPKIEKAPEEPKKVAKKTKK